MQWKQDDYLPKHPFVLYYDTDDSAVGEVHFDRIGDRSFVRVEVVE